MRPYTSMVKPKNRRVLLLILIVFSISTTALFFIRGGLDSCGGDRRRNGPPDSVSGRVQLESPLEFMRSKLVLLVSHELSLSGGPLLLMELAFLLKSVGAQVIWITNQKSIEMNEVTYSLEHKMLDRGVQDITTKKVIGIGREQRGLYILDSPVVAFNSSTVLYCGTGDWGTPLLLLSRT